jgi:hypothetical protein
MIARTPPDTYQTVRSAANTMMPALSWSKIFFTP